MTEKLTEGASGSGIATLAGDRVLDVYYPEPRLGADGEPGTATIGDRAYDDLRGGDSPVTVVLDGGELEVDVDESLHVDLTGWALPVYRGELSEELVAELRASS